jgi:hypothetical protein
MARPSSKVAALRADVEREIPAGAIAEASLGLGRIVALYHRSSTFILLLFTNISVPL